MKKEKVEPKTTKEEVVAINTKKVCSNCNDSGLFCRVCSSKEVTEAVV